MAGQIHQTAVNGIDSCYQFVNTLDATFGDYRGAKIWLTFYIFEHKLKKWTCLKVCAKNLT